MSEFDVADDLFSLARVSKKEGKAPEMFLSEAKKKRLRLPLKVADKRRLTWHKLSRTIKKKLVNEVSSRDDCWFVKSNHSGSNNGSIYIVRLTGKGNPWMLHRMLHALREPADYEKLYDRKVQVAHRCGLGRARRKGELCCINPHHTVAVDARTNSDHKGCKYGSAELCPHDPKCIFNWPDTGKPKPCFNLEQRVDCDCDRKCSHVSVLHQE